MKPKLPIGIQTFRRLREDGCYYVDNAPCGKRLADERTHYFLSRPRCFGKSLFPDTLKELFEGNEALFRGLDDFAGMRELIESWFDGIPYEWHMNNDIARYEGYYASVIYSLLAAMGLDVIPEESSARGRGKILFSFIFRVDFRLSY